MASFDFEDVIDVAEGFANRIYVLNEAAALLEPLDVGPIRDVVPDEHRDDQREADHERKAREIVHVL